MSNTSKVQGALIENFPVGTSRALCNELYGKIIIVSTGVAGNLILCKNFYPIAYIRTESLTAVVNGEEPCPPNDDFHNLQRLIKNICDNIVDCYSVDEFFAYVDSNQDFGRISPAKNIKINRFKGTIPDGYTKAYKSEIQTALTKNFSVGTSRALCNEHYGEIIIVSTGVAGNLILQHGFYPTAYIRPLTLTAAINSEESDSPDGQFVKLQKLIKQTCATIIERYGVDELVEFVDMNQSFGT